MIKKKLVKTIWLTTSHEPGSLIINVYDARTNRTLRPNIEVTAFDGTAQGDLTAMYPGIYTITIAHGGYFTNIDSVSIVSAD